MRQLDDEEPLDDVTKSIASGDGKAYGTSSEPSGRMLGLAIARAVIMATRVILECLRVAKADLAVSLILDAQRCIGTYAGAMR